MQTFDNEVFLNYSKLRCDACTNGKTIDIEKLMFFNPAFSSNHIED